MSLPKDVTAVCRQQAVVRVLWVGRGEGGALRQNDEENDCAGKQINLLAFVGLSEVDLESHVAGCTQLRVQQARAISALVGRSKAEVCDLQVVVFIQNQVFRLQVAVCVALLVHELEAVEHLDKVVAGLGLSETTAQSNEVEELATADQLEDNESHCLCAFLGIGLVALVDLVKLDDVGVFEVGEGAHLVLDQVVEGFVVVQDLDCVPSAARVLGELDFAGNTAAEGSSERVLIKVSWHFSLIIIRLQLLLL